MEKRLIPQTTLANSFKETTAFVKKTFKILIGFFALLSIIPIIVLSLLLGISIYSVALEASNQVLSSLSISIIIITTVLLLCAFLFVSIMGLGGMAYAVEMFYANEKPTVKNMLSAGFKRFGNVFSKAFIIVLLEIIAISPMMIFAITNSIYLSQNYHEPSQSIFLGFGILGLYLIFLIVTLCIQIFLPFVIYISAFRKHSLINTLKYNFKIAFKNLHWLKFIGYTLLLGLGAELVLFCIMMIAFVIGFVAFSFTAIMPFFIIPAILIFFCIFVVLFATTFAYMIFQSSFSLITFRSMENETFIIE